MIEGSGRAVKAALLLALPLLGGCEGPPPPFRIIIGSADTVIINHIRPTRIPVRVLDAKGRTLTDSSVQFEWLSGDRVSLTPAGIVDCKQSGDAIIRAAVGELQDTAVLSCRPVERVRIRGPIQFVLPAEAEEMQVEAVGLDNAPVTLLSGSADIRDTTIADIDGTRVIPRKPGSTVAGVRVGNRSAGVGIHVYERVSTLSAGETGQQMVAVPLRVSAGQIREWTLRPGGWMLTMLPEEDEETGIRLRIKGAQCSPVLTKRRFACSARGPLSVIVYHPSTSSSAPELSGYLLVRHLGDP